MLNGVKKFYIEVCICKLCQNCTNSTAETVIFCKNLTMSRFSRNRLFYDVHTAEALKTVDVKGTAYLCFPIDHAWFRGTINTNDESNYSLFGELVTADTPDKKVKPTVNLPEKIKILSLGEIQEENVTSDGDVKESQEDDERKLSPRDYYRVVLFDHFSGVKQTLPKMYTKFVKNAKGQQVQVFESKGKTVSFTVENKFVGEKAEIENHKIMGPTTPVGIKTVLYVGNITIRTNEGTDALRSRAWSF